jgi:auxin influx carrier (AUX1 LAX family)
VSLNILWSLVIHSNAYYINANHDKRTWTFVFGAISTLVVFLPTIHNYRIWSLMGVITTTYTAWFMFISALINGEVTHNLLWQNLHHMYASEAKNY